MTKILLLGSFLWFLSGCETGYKGESAQANNPCSAQNSEQVEAKEDAFRPYYEERIPLSKFEGGYINDGLDLGGIRVSETAESVRLVLDSYRLDSQGKRTQKVNRAGTYSFVYSPEKRLLSGSISGYRTFSAELPHFSRNSLIEKIYMDKDLDDTGFRFHIKFRDDVSVKVFDLENPGRIVIDANLI